MKKIILLILLSLSSIMAKESKISLPVFELDVKYSNNATEQLVERNEIITLVVTVSLPPKNKVSYFKKLNHSILIQKEIDIQESTLLSIDDIMIDKKYENKLDDLIIVVNAYSSPAPFEDCQPEYQSDASIEGDIKKLKNKKHLFEIKVKDDFVIKI